MTPYSTRAIAIKIGERYFHGWTRLGGVQTAWHIAGAKLWIDSPPYYGQTLKKLKAKGKRCVTVKVNVSDF